MRMKKSLLALAVLGTFAGAAQAQQSGSSSGPSPESSSVTMYGIIDTGVNYVSKAVPGADGAMAPGSSAGSRYGLQTGTLQGSRLGFKGQEALGNGDLSALFQLEAGFDSTNGGLKGGDKLTTSNLFARRAVVGLKSNTSGTILLGRQTDFADTISAMTSVNDFGGMTGAVGHNLNRLEGVRSNNAITYTTADYSGFQAQLLYGFGNSSSVSDGQAFGIGAQYVSENADGLPTDGPSVGINYYQSKLGSSNNSSDTSLIDMSVAQGQDKGSTALKVLNIVGSYQVGPARVYANWSRVKQPLNDKYAPTYSNGTNSFPLPTQLYGLENSSKADIYELGTAYTLNPNLKLLAAVQYTRAQLPQFTPPGDKETGTLLQFNLGADYMLSQRTDLYGLVAYLKPNSKIRNPGVFGDTTGGVANDNTIVGKPSSSQTAVSVGIRHRF